MFEKLYSVVGKSEDELAEILKEEITGHLESLDRNINGTFQSLQERRQFWYETSSLFP